MDYKARASSGKQRKLGSTSVCEVCGGEYVVCSGRQRYCPSCADSAVRDVDRRQAIAWAAGNMDYARRTEDRQSASAPIPCVVCGTPFVPDDSSKTCSAACRAKLRRDSHSAYEREHKAQRNAYKRQLAADKIAAMTPDELAQHRAAINAKARENYHKRKVKQAGKPTDEQ